MKKIFPFIAFAVLFSSCRKIIQIDLNSSAPQIVIQADLKSGTDSFKVYVAQTRNYFGNGTQAKLNNAIVSLFDGTTNYNIPLTGDGIYSLSSFTAFAGKEYKLEVMVNGKKFTASSKMPNLVKIDSLTTKYLEGGFLDPGYEVTCHFKDPEAEANYYILETFQNGDKKSLMEGIYLHDDKFNNGKPVHDDFFDRYQTGETIRIQLKSIDSKVFDYFYTLDQTLNNPNGPAPANPNSNFDGGALGYFGAFAIDEQSILIP